MSSISLSRAISSNYIQGFIGLAQGSTSGTAALRGGGGVTISSALRSGARLLVGAVQTLNATITVVNVSRGSLDQLNTYTDQLLDLAKTASASTTSPQARRDLDLRFKAIGNDFKDLLEQSKIQDNNYLTKGGLEAIFQRAGLDANTSDSIGDVFADFQVTEVDDYLASPSNVGKRPAPIPVSAYTPKTKSTKVYDSIFDATRSITNRADAYLMVEDLKALKGQIEHNISAYDGVVDVLGKNLTLIRETGLAFLDASSQITSFKDAEAAAQFIQDEVRKNASAALSQAENLEPMTVAALALGSG